MRASSNMSYLPGGQHSEIPEETTRVVADQDGVQVKSGEGESVQGLPSVHSPVREGQGIPGLQVMGIFLGCSLLMTLRWRGMTAPLVFEVKGGRHPSFLGLGGQPAKTQNIRSKEYSM
jgi:hypothetical protein